MKKSIVAASVLGCLLATVPVAMAQEMTMNASPAAHAAFPLFVSSAIGACLQGSGSNPPSATVTVTQGNLNDTLTLKLRHVKKNLAFDLFTVENTPFLSTGAANPSFVAGHFGLAWYQSDVQANAAGNATVTIKTILVNQIFGFDPDAGLAPTNTFNVGIWFNDPADAAACGFVGTTPFNGEHKAGPLAMISGLDPTSQLGPLCLSPSGTPGVCNP